MALFNVSVLVTLRLDRTEREAIQRMAGALEGLAAKLNEPPEDESAVQARIDDMARRLQDANDKLEAAAQSAPGA